MSRGVWASTILGLTSAALAWAVVNLLPVLTPIGGGYGRLDQVTMWLLGGFVGAAVLGGRALRHRAAVVLESLNGFALGGASMLLGASLFAALPIPDSPVAFIAMRAVAWGACGGLAALALALWVQHRDRRAVTRGALIGGGGGAIAGLVFALPGPSEVWQAVAFLVVGGILGFAVVSPLLRHAVAIADRAPGRGAVPTILALREQALFEGGAITLGAATLACQGGRVALHPPPAGVVFNGRAVMAPTFIQNDGSLLVAGVRYRIQLMGQHE